ncbi:MAG: type II secretion system F family protein, partial [Phycisphaerales bacterium]|nr:type II secretion system F family protein [Phycisphaerales bacterium]
MILWTVLAVFFGTAVIAARFASPTRLSTLLGAGTPLVTALNAILEQQTKETMRKALTQVRENVNEGVSLADALAKHPKVFPELFTDMVGSGEASGALDIVLVRVADYMEEHARNVNKVRAVMTYPILMFFVAGAIVFLIFTQAVPRLKILFEGMDRALPPTTRILIATGDFLGKWWPLLLAMLVLGAIGFQRYGRTKAGRRRIDGWKLKVPVMGELLLKVAVARFARTLSTLLAGGIPVLKALEIVQSVVGNKVLAEAIGEASVSVEEGSSLSGPLRASGVFPPILIHMIAVGEQTGELETMLARVA